MLIFMEYTNEPQWTYEVVCADMVAGDVMRHERIQRWYSIMVKKIHT